MMLPSGDAYAVARALAGLDVDDSQLSAQGAIVLNCIRTFKPDMTNIRQVLGNEILAQVFKIDVNAPPPSGRRLLDDVLVPSLPSSAVVGTATPDGWVADFMGWAARRSPLTPPLFLQAGALWLLGLAIARRAYLPMSFSRVYPHLYVLWVAPTGVAAKTTGLNLVYEVASAVTPHLLLPSHNTPEVLLHKLAGGKPSNYADLSLDEKAIEDAGRVFGARRGMIVDEASRLFLGKKYLEGLIEIFLQLYDAHQPIIHESHQHGKTVVRNQALSLLGATTPARLALNMLTDFWLDGLMARFALLYAPAGGAVDDSLDLDSSIPAGLTAPLKALYDNLPPIAGDGDDKPLAIRLDGAAYRAYKAYDKGLRKLLDGIEEKLRGNYVRFPTMALKVALSLALMDNKNNPAGAVVTADHWGVAQTVVEAWRASAHRLVPALEKSEELDNQERVLQLLERSQDLSRRDIQRLLKIRYARDLDSVLRSLVDSGEIQEVESLANNGKAIRLYRRLS